MAQRTVVTDVSNARFYSDGTVLIKNVRLSYPHLTKVWGGKNKDGTDQTKKFSMVGLADKATHKAAKDLVVKVIDGILTERNKGAKIKADAKFFRDGDLAGKPECDDMWTINASESEERPPKLRKSDGKTPYDPKKDGELFYPGCYVSMLVKPWWQDNENGKRVNASLLAVQFVKDGERIGEAGITDDDVDGTFDDEGDGDLGDGGDTDGL